MRTLTILLPVAAPGESMLKHASSFALAIAAQLLLAAPRHWAGVFALAVCRPRRWRRIPCLMLAAAVVVAAAGSLLSHDAIAQAAADGPGTLSHFGLARKDCLGTARNTTSKVWYTIANGVLSDVYYPAVDNTNVETLQYIVTDGSTLTDLQTRDMAYTVQALDPGGMECRVTTTARSGKYQIVTDYVTDPSRNA